ncbi:hypothetical protein I4F81_006514 [Pyropia yezoensis]|uniref:Uncharacterized protein n=1 Tax=Pyropia yezoensis TaxID=2788 RepID=A0ACC3C1B7_PYRYE|nr:hypothetical protein I4F81_006514 [Neopyropia yezoensis]
MGTFFSPGGGVSPSGGGLLSPSGAFGRYASPGGRGGSGGREPAAPGCTTAAGPTVAATALSSRVEHAAFLRRCLREASASAPHVHLTCIASTLGDVFATFLRMQDHPDGRVRLRGFHIFLAALDVLFAATPSDEAAAAGAPGGSLSAARAAHSFFDTSIDMDKYTAGGQVIDALWEAISRLIGSPWRTLNSLSFWVLAALENAAHHAAITARTPGQIRLRRNAVLLFTSTHLFPSVERALAAAPQGTRLWGMRLLEVWMRGRELNASAAGAAALPLPPDSLWRALEPLRRHRNPDIREAVAAVTDRHVAATAELCHAASAQAAPSTLVSLLSVGNGKGFRPSLSAAAPALRRSFGKDTANAPSSNAAATNGGDSSAGDAEGAQADAGIELWFPPLATPGPPIDEDMYSKPLGAFANAVIGGGEEPDAAPGGMAGFGDEREESGTMRTMATGATKKRTNSAGGTPAAATSTDDPLPADSKTPDVVNPDLECAPWARPSSSPGSRQSAKASSSKPRGARSAIGRSLEDDFLFKPVHASDGPDGPDGDGRADG